MTYTVFQDIIDWFSGFTGFWTTNVIPYVGAAVVGVAGAAVVVRFMVAWVRKSRAAASS